MKLIQTVSEMQRHADALRRKGLKSGLVPTMGALHEAHLALVEEAMRHIDRVTVSVFVNPTQFAPGEDFDQYPRTLEEDRAKLEKMGAVDILFAPSPLEMYPGGEMDHRVWVQTRELDAQLCGRHRPGHFSGVTTVVAKLFNICRPDLAVFGLKDAQQYFILRRMVKDLNFGVEMIGFPIVREPDGLAMSSRNRYLSTEERAQAVVLSDAVKRAGEMIESGTARLSDVVDAMRLTIETSALAKMQYIEVVDTENLQPVSELEPGREVLAAVAVYFGKTRLIDNVIACVPTR